MPTVGCSRTGGGAPKSASGYDLTALFVGAEGALGLITELTLRLHGQPEAVMSAVAAVPTVGAAVGCVIATMQMGLTPARIEFLDQATVAACNAFSRLSLPLAPQLLVDFHGTPEGVAEDMRHFRGLAGDFGADGLQLADRQQDRNRLWPARHSAYRAILASRPGSKAVVTDVCVPISRLAKAVDATPADIAATGLQGPILGHVGDGNFHAILLVDPASVDEVSAAKALAVRMAERSLRLGGTITGEHGIGFGKRGLMATEHGAAWAVMGSLKQALDPLGLMSPGKVVPGPDDR